MKPRVCETCGGPVKDRRRKYCRQTCVPFTVRSEGGRLGRKNFARKHRALKFREEIARLTSGKTKVSTDDLLAVFDAIYDRAYLCGWHCRDGQERRRRLALERHASMTPARFGGDGRDPDPL
jgi:hypothetical protein